ncbi:MAG: lasso peptide isopeptide bond-forming cyclase [Cyanobacteria bacterium J06623_7]
MSAIVGINYADGRAVEGKHIVKMLDVLAHRGNDDCGTWYSDGMAFGQRLLRTTLESVREELPGQETSLTIVADARIDNRAELIARLELSADCADGQLILRAYRRWGESCVDWLVGDFAFAIWDTATRQLFCARDHFGVKPFYYYHGAETLVFASEIKALFCVPTVPRRLNEIRVQEFITSEFYDKTNTIYQQIWRLPPAHTLTLNSEGLKIERYWQLDPSYELKLDSDAEYAARFRAIFTEAVRCRLRSSFPVGSMLSGGMDSSAIAATASKILAEERPEQPLHTFSAVFEGVPESDESFYIGAVTQDPGIKPHYIYGDRHSPLVDIERIISYQDEPQFAANLYLNWIAYQLARQQGVRVVLDGFDGDSAVSHGFGYMRELARGGKWLALIPELRGYCKNFQTAFFPLFWSYIEQYGVRPLMAKSKLTRYIYWRYRGLADRLRAFLTRNQPKLSSLSLIAPELLQRTNFRQYRQQLAAQNFIATPNERAEHFKAIDVGSIVTTLELLDRTAAPFDVEVRYPFWDKRLVEFCLSLPANQKMRQGLTRMIMRQGLAGILPPEIQQRGDKGNLSMAFEQGLRTHEPDFGAALLTDDASLIADYINLDITRAAYHSYSRGQNTPVDVMTIWKSLNLALWFKNNRDRLEP